MQGDKLASGQKSAQFAVGSENRDAPIELHNVAPEEPETLEGSITVIDRRSCYDVSPVEAVKKPEPKFPEKEYNVFQPIMDRLLIKRCPDDPNLELLEDGSVRNKKTGLIIAAQYRQHSNTGIVLAAGTMVSLGGQIFPMSDFVKVGNRVTYGDYNSEVFLMKEDKVRKLCDAVQMNYEEDPEGLRIVRVQDVRGVEVPVGADNE